MCGQMLAFTETGKSGEGKRVKAGVVLGSLVLRDMIISLTWASTK